MSLRAHPAEETATLPDGRDVVVRVGLFEDAYVPRREIDTVTLDLLVDGRVEATVETVLEPAHESEARTLAHLIAVGLASGELEPTAASVERLALTIPD